ncbi:MAG: class I SAM-dependent methyltransferase [Desulfobacterales bacterium]|nr:class I SAM-dependent methyltransferase [Desulfobacterales bacterium]MBF0398250.1 class I SAM-dependent methyltransferase [Desulfobacterales bacterium]
MSTDIKEIIRSYFDSNEGTNNHFLNIYGMGGGGEIEAPYRQYFELRHLKKIVKFKKNMKILDLGVGNGRWAISIAPLVKQYTGVDFSRKGLDIAQQNIDRMGLQNIKLHEYSITDYSDDELYDVIYLGGVSQFLEDDEIKKMLANLKPCLKPETVIIDRSTVNYKKREIFKKPNYYAIFRTPDELRCLYGSIGFDLDYQKRSYRFLRGARLIRRLKPLNNYLSLFILTFYPFSLFIMLWFSCFADILLPKPFEGGDRSHDFFLFKRIIFNT